MLMDLTELYHQSFRPALRQVFSDKDLTQIVDLMVERGLRLHCPVAELWTPTAEGELLEGAIDEELRDDELQFLTESHAMRPY